MLNPKQFLARRSAVKSLKAGTVRYGQREHYNVGHGNISGGYHDASNPFGPSKSEFTTSPADKFKATKSAAKTAGLSDRKINKVVTKTANKSKKNGTFAKAYTAGANQSRTEDAFDSKYVKPKSTPTWNTNITADPFK